MVSMADGSFSMFTLDCI
ncbi:hypothetical protein J001_00868 [Cryptococcus neoformans]|nr:hypothetical protein J001_00868 [Cryptococcus neoformans var. grubii]